MITKAELTAMIAALESQSRLSIKEEKYLKVCKELLDCKRFEEEMEELSQEYYGSRL